MCKWTGRLYGKEWRVIAPAGLEIRSANLKRDVDAMEDQGIVLCIYKRNGHKKKVWLIVIGAVENSPFQNKYHLSLSIFFIG